jgi:large subunit ribosomal protein L24
VRKETIKSKLKKGDQVIVNSGSFKGTIGEIEKVLSDGRLHVAGISCKRHVKANPNNGVEGGILDKPKAILPCKVSIYNPITKKADRIGKRFLEDGTKVRFFKSNNEVIDV